MINIKKKKEVLDPVLVNIGEIDELDERLGEVHGGGDRSAALLVVGAEGVAREPVQRRTHANGRRDQLQDLGVGDLRQEFRLLDPALPP